jgi:hypothetical protein
MLRCSPAAAAGALLLALALALPAAARAAPALEPLKPCYVTAQTKDGPQSEGIRVRATGFTPNSKVDLTIDGAPIAGSVGLQTDAAGTLDLAQPVPAPFVEAGSRPFTLTLAEQGNPASAVSATAKSTALGVTITPTQAAPSQRVRFAGLGFTGDKPVFAHYLRRGKLRRTVRMARRPGDCGSFSARRRQLPIRHPHLGRWIVQFDQSRKYVDPDVAAIVYVRLGIRITLVPR